MRPLFPPIAFDYQVDVSAGESTVIDALANDVDANGDHLRFVRVAGVDIDTEDGLPDTIVRPYGALVVVNPGVDPAEPDAAYLTFLASEKFAGKRKAPYTVEDLAPNPVINGFALDEPNPSHTARTNEAQIRPF